jgi:hypothetical protein
MKRLRILSAVLVLASAGSAGAADLLGRERVELIPFFGYRIGGHFNGIVDAVEYPFDGAKAYGGLVDVNLNMDNYKLEFLWSHQSTGFERLINNGVEPNRLQIDHFQGGIMQEVGTEKARWAISALFGGTRFASPGLGSDLRFSGSVGACIKVFPTERVGLRFDARAHGVWTKGAAGAFCANGTCLFAFEGTMMWQGDFTGGVIIAF